MAARTAKLKSELQELWLVALGAVPGAWIRWQADNDLVVNVVGAAILGLLLGLPFRPRRQLLIGVGFCGALTTFSSWMVDCVKLIASGDWLSALGLIALTLGFGLGAATAGFLIGQQIKRSRPAQSPPSAQHSQE